MVLKFSRTAGSAVALREHFETSGVWLFRWRSYLPLILFLVVLAGLRDYEYPRASHRLQTVWELVCFGVGLIGLAIRCYAIGYAAEGTSGRVTRRQEADALNTTGLYSAIRHPLYLGNYLMWISAAVLTRTIWVPLIVTLAFWLFYERVMSAEEAFLRGKYHETFDRWADATPAFIPTFRQWRSPQHLFNSGRVLQSEKSSALGLIATFTFVNMLIQSRLPDRVSVDAMWLILLALGVTYYAVMATKRKIDKRAAKKRSAA